MQVRQVNGLLAWWKKKRMLRDWRKRSRRKRNIRLKVGRLDKMFSEFHRRGISYVVLRWFDEIPGNPRQEAQFAEDIDLYWDGQSAEDLADVAIHHAGPVACDVFSVTGRGGTSYHGMPYYPPILGRMILEERQIRQNAFYVPSPMLHFFSLAYHLVYHKGLESGIPSGCELASNPSPKRKYGEKLQVLGQSLNISLLVPYTLMSLHDYLKQNDWDMPYDLLERWPLKSPWHLHLLMHEKSLLEHWAEKLPDLLVFFIREDILDRHLEERVYELLERKFTILRRIELSESQIQRVMRKVRGGSWIEHRGTTWIRPVKAVLCYDFNPAPVAQNDEKTNAYPLVRNRNVFWKHEIRDRLNETHGEDREIIGIHGSDNGYEAQHMLQAIFSERTDCVNDELLEQIKGMMAEGHPEKCEYC